MELASLIGLPHETTWTWRNGGVTGDGCACGPRGAVLRRAGAASGDKDAQPEKGGETEGTEASQEKESMTIRDSGVSRWVGCGCMIVVAGVALGAIVALLSGRP